MKVTSLILAGGKNQRLGREKANEVIGGQSIIEGVIEKLKPLSQQILIVTSKERRDFTATGDIKVITDLFPDKGPLGGIYTGLMSSQQTSSIVVACDMPFLNTYLLRYMIERSNSYDAVVPRLGERKLEPLHAVYSRNCLDRMKTWLERNQLGVHDFIGTLNVRYIERAECQRLDPELLSFFNINNQSDLERAIALYAVQESKRPE